jgi:beta-glucosidase
VAVTNTGEREGDEIVQIYLKDDEASVRVPHHKLCCLKCVSLKPTETVTISFTISAEQFMIIKGDGSRDYEPGSFMIYTGGHQPDSDSEAMSGRKLERQTIVLK